MLHFGTILPHSVLYLPLHHEHFRRLVPIAIIVNNNGCGCFTLSTQNHLVYILKGPYDGKLYFPQLPEIKDVM